MKTTALALATLVTLVGAGLASAPSHARELTFEERVRAQEAIERVYYRHQIGTSKSFEEAVPRAVLEGKVLKYLKQTVALERLWSTPVTGDMLQQEMERQARQTRMPERLSELYQALGNDPLLVRECLARPVLVDRLARNFFAFDGRIHAQAHRKAEELRQALLRYGIGAFGKDPRRREVEVDQVAEEETTRPAPDESERAELEPEAFARWRSQLPQRVGEIGLPREEREAFVISSVLEERPGWARIVTFTLPKESWDVWWQEQADDLDVSTDSTAQEIEPHLPVPGATGRARFEPDDIVGGRTAGVPLASCLPDDTWGSGPWPVGRDHHTAVWTGSLVVVWGGGNGSYLSTGGRYDPATDTWTATSVGAAPEGRRRHSAVWTGSRMVVWGGENLFLDPASLDTGGQYDPIADAWTPTSTSGAPAARSRHTAVWTGSRMVVWGGANGDSGYLQTGGLYDPATDTWTPTGTVGAPAGRQGHTAVWTDGVMVVWGGTTSAATFASTGGRYDPATNSWVPTSITEAPASRSLHAAVWTGSLMIVWGGYDGGPPLDSGGRYDPATDTWTPTSTAGAPGARRQHTAVWSGSQMVVWGGLDNTATAMNTGGRYDPASDGWTPTSTAGAPEARYLHTASWTGSRMIVWGGSHNAPLGSGGRYDPTTDSWTPTSTNETGPPLGRTNHTAVWTGNVMVIWGGVLGSPATYLNSGGQYDPIIDGWTPTSIAGAPAARAFHTAVWTGSQMIVWGGGYDNTGGRYDPLTDTWTPTSTFQAPERRTNHTAVWTGSAMVIWGGIHNDEMNTGGRYDPAADAWAPTSTADAPSARYDHTAVWTGSEMLIWGGIPFVPPFTGGRYDPISDTWTPMSIVGAPSHRHIHTAVWTGSEMVIWGGFNTTNLDTGGRYDPVTDSWTPTSLVGAPSPRNGHTAVWTGREMVVWGADSLSTGGRYDPADDSWTPTTTVGAPEKRTSHTAVWTGNVMIVWGGDNNTGELDSGGRYVVGDDDDGDGYFACDADCNDADAGAYAAPGEITGQVFLDATTLAWNSAAPAAGHATVHDVAVGLISELPVGSGSSEACLASGIAGNSTTDEATPPSGDGFWYLVRGRNSCEIGSYGTDSAGAPRTSGACP